jgi:methylglutaconyl-CoA hydratase
VTKKPRLNPPVRLVESSHGVASLVFARPAERNLIDADMIVSLHRFLVRLRRDKHLRCLILRADGPVFSGGARLQWFEALARVSTKKRLTQTRLLVNLFAELNEFPVPVIGVVQGAAVGGAIALLAVCDVAIARGDAQFSLSEARLGLVPACAAPFIIAKIGQSWTRRLFVTGERFTAQRAYEIGLIHEIAAGRRNLEAKLKLAVASILACAPAAARTAKRLVLDLSLEHRKIKAAEVPRLVARALAEQIVSSEAKEGIAAFLGKRTPTWRAHED